LEKRLGEYQNRSGRRREEKNLAPNRDSNFDPSAVQPVAIPTALSRLRKLIVETTDILTENFETG
jgi:hypothetical protein